MANYRISRLTQLPPSTPSVNGVIVEMEDRDTGVRTQVIGGSADPTLSDPDIDFFCWLEAEGFTPNDFGVDCA